MAAQDQQRQGRFIPALVVGGVSYWAWGEIGGPIIAGGTIAPLPALAAAGMALAGVVLAADSLALIANLCGYVKARMPTGRKGVGGFAKSLREVRHSLIPHGWGPYFGAKGGVGVFPLMEGPGYVLGPTGVGKTTRIILPGLLALNGQPQAWLDYKSDITPQVARAFRKRGVRLRVINLGGLFEKEVGQGTDFYNPLILVLETFTRPGGLEDVTDIVRELCLVLDPEEAGKSGLSDASFWKNNARRIIGFVIIVKILTDGQNATLGSCLQLLNDKKSLTHHALWAAGRLETVVVGEDGVTHTEAARFPVDSSPWASLHDPAELANFSEFLRALASGIADILQHPDGRLADSFLSNARESALSSFDITTRANRITSKTTFRFRELKDDGPVTSVAIMIDPDKLAAHTNVLGVLHWAMLVELRRHPRKTRKVVLWVDEAGNLPWPRLADDLTTLRGYGVVPILAFQNYAHFEKRHGKVGLETLLSEAEVALALPGQRNPQTLAMLEKRLSTASVIARSNNANGTRGSLAMDGYSLQEDGRPVMYAEEIRRLDQGILWIGKNRPLLVEVPTVAQMWPLKNQLDPSPFYGKPYRKWTKLWIRPYPRSLLSWLAHLAKLVLTAGRRR